MKVLYIALAACILLPFLNAIIEDFRERYERREAEERRRAKEEAEAKAKAERALQKRADSIAKPTEAVEAPRCKRGRPCGEPEPVQNASEGAAHAAPIVRGNNAFAGQVVAFTGALPNMTRDEAIAAVTANGGRAYKTMPVGTTLLVVGDNKGKNTKKLDKADMWIGQVRKITSEQFDAMLKAPLTLTPDEFAAVIAAR